MAVGPVLLELLEVLRADPQAHPAVDRHVLQGGLGDLVDDRAVDAQLTSEHSLGDLDGQADDLGLGVVEQLAAVDGRALGQLADPGDLLGHLGPHLRARLLPAGREPLGAPAGEPLGLGPLARGPRARRGSAPPRRSACLDRRERGRAGLVRLLAGGLVGGRDRLGRDPPGVLELALGLGAGLGERLLGLGQPLLDLDLSGRAGGLVRLRLAVPGCAPRRRRRPAGAGRDRPRPRRAVAAAAAPCARPAGPTSGSGAPITTPSFT